jgi:hypothetical protein
MAPKVKGTRVVEASVESSDSGVEWSAITAGALAAVGVSIILTTFGPGMGLATLAAWYLSGPPPATLGIAAGIWLIVMQWLASGVGGYFAGRLRKKWVGIRTGEVAFRDVAHGFLAWVLATLMIMTLFAIAFAVGESTVQQIGSQSPDAVEEARKAAVSLSFYTSLSLLIGAFIASLTGLFGGYQRDD